MSGFPQPKNPNPFHCRIGWHAWEKWTPLNTVNYKGPAHLAGVPMHDTRIVTTRYEQDRYCQGCGIGQRRSSSP